MDAKEFIDLIEPNHGRTSCDDVDPVNGFYTRTGDTWHGRCTRCMYLEALKTGSVPKGFDPDECAG